MQKVAISSKYYKPILLSRKRYCIMYGGRSSGKSDTAAQKMIMLCREEEGFRGVAVRKVFATLKDSCYSKLKSVIARNNWEDEFYCTVSPLEMTHIPSGRKILFKGLDKAEKIKSLDDVTVCWYEEALELTQDDFIKVDTSLRSPHPTTLKQSLITFNPESEAHFLSKRFFPHKSTYENATGDFTYIKSKEDNTVILHTNYIHNDFLGADDIETITRLKRVYGDESNYVRVYVYGLFGNALKGLVFENINYADKFPKREDCKKYGYGLDFGFTNDPTALIECALAHGELWFREIVFKTGLVNAGKGCNSIEDYLIGDNAGGEEIIADSAEPKSIEEIRRAGFNIRGVTKGKNSIEGGLAQMKKYKINIVKSPNIEKEVKRYKYKEDKEGDTTNTPIDAWNHAIDGMRYWCMENIQTLDGFTGVIEI